MNVSRDGGGNWGKDIAGREADNLWMHGVPGGLKCSAGNATHPEVPRKNEGQCAGTQRAFSCTEARGKAVLCTDGPGLQQGQNTGKATAPCSVTCEGT